MLRCLFSDNYANTQQVNRAIIWLQQIQPWLHFLKHYCTRSQIFTIRRSVSTTGCYRTHLCCWNSAPAFTPLEDTCCIADSWDDECKVKKVKLSLCKPLSADGELEVKLLSFFTAVLGESYQSDSCSVRLCHVDARGAFKRLAGPHIRSVFGKKNRKIYSPWVFKPQSLGLPAPSPYTKYVLLNDGDTFWEMGR